MRHRLVVADGDADRFGGGRSALAKGLFQPAVAAAEQGELASLRQQFVQAAEHQVQALLLTQPAHDCKQRLVGRHGQAERPLQRRLATGLACGVLHIEAVGQLHVGRRIPDCRVDRVQDAGEHAGATAQQAIEAAALLGRLDFARVGRADRGELVGVVKAGFHERQLAVVFEPIDAKGRVGQAQVGKIPGWKNALVGQVVHREHAADAASPGRLCKCQVGRRQRGVPVVCVHHFGLPLRIESLRQPGRCPSQQGKAAMVVAVGLTMVVFIRIARPVVERGRVDHIGVQGVVGWHPRDRQATAKQAGAIAPGRTEFGHRHQPGEARNDRRKPWQQHPDIFTGCSQRRRQRACNISQPARLEQRKEFGADLQYPHHQYTAPALAAAGVFMTTWPTSRV